MQFCQNANYLVIQIQEICLFRLPPLLPSPLPLPIEVLKCSSVQVFERETEKMSLQQKPKLHLESFAENQKRFTRGEMAQKLSE